MNIKEKIISLSPLSFERTNRILAFEILVLGNSFRTFNERLDQYKGMELSAVPKAEVENILFGLIDTCGEYLLHNHASASFRQHTRDCIEKWILDLGEFFEISKEKLQERMEEAIGYPARYSLTTRLLKELQARDGISKNELSEKLGIDKRSVYTEIEKIKGTRGEARIDGQRVIAGVLEFEKRSENSKQMEKYYKTPNSVHPISLQMNVSQVGILLSALAKEYVNEEKVIALHIGLDVWCQLTDYGKQRVKSVFGAVDPVVQEFIEILNEELNGDRDYLALYRTDMDFFDDVNSDEQLLLLYKGGRRKTVEIDSEGERIILENCLISRTEDGEYYVETDADTTEEKRVYPLIPDYFRLVD